MHVNNKIYALYKGDNYLMEGTITEISKFLGVTRNTVHYYKSPTYLKRSNDSRSIRLVEIDE